MKPCLIKLSTVWFVEYPKKSGHIFWEEMLVFSFINALFYCCTKEESLYCTVVSVHSPEAESQRMRRNYLQRLMPLVVNGSQPVHTEVSFQIFICIVMKCGTDMSCAEKIIPWVISDLLTFPVAPPAGQRLNVSTEISKHLMHGLEKFGSDTQAPLKMAGDNFGDPLTFQQAPSSG